MEDISLPPLQPDEVRVEMKWAPINPADLNVLEGTYGHLPPLPAVAGLEGPVWSPRRGPGSPG
jgi:trans-2-enoyl-CoA reductase